jgi:hypothetical protein
MQVCVGSANSSSPTENSARHTFQDRAYLGGRIGRKRTKKSGIIYCLVTSHPPKRPKPAPNLVSRAPKPPIPGPRPGRANSREFRLSRPNPQFPPNQANSGPRPKSAQFIFGNLAPYLRAFWQIGQFSPRGKADFPLVRTRIRPNGGILAPNSR